MDERDVKRLKELRDLLDEEFGNQIAADIEKEVDAPETQPVYTITLEKTVKSIKYIVLSEDIAQGQRVESFRVMAEFASGSQYPLYQGNCIGHKKICQLQDPFEQQNRLLDDRKERISRIKVQITAARDEVLMKEIKVYE